MFNIGSFIILFSQFSLIQKDLSSVAGVELSLSSPDKLSQSL